MAEVEPLQEVFIEAHPGQKVALKWRIKNISKSKPWPTIPFIKNFSSDNFFGESGDLNDIL